MKKKNKKELEPAAEEPRVSDIPRMRHRTRVRKATPEMQAVDEAGPGITPFSGPKERRYDARKNPDGRKKGLPTRDERVLEAQRIELAEKKANFIRVLTDCLGIVSQAVQQTGVPYKTFCHWRDTDMEFAEMLTNDVEDRAIDYVESKLLKRVKDEDTSSIQFFLRTRGRRRGYGDETKVVGPNGGAIEVNMTLSSPIMREEVPYHSLVTMMKEAMPILEARAAEEAAAKGVKRQ